MLDTEQSDTFRSETESPFCVFRSIRIGPDSELAELVHHFHELDETRVLGCVHSVDGASVDKALGSVEAEDVSFMELSSFELQYLVCQVDGHGIASYDTAFSPSAGYECGM